MGSMEFIKLKNIRDENSGLKNVDKLSVHPAHSVMKGLTKGRNSDVREYLESQRVTVSPFQQSDIVVGHEKAIMSIKKAFSSKMLLKREVSTKSGVHAILLVGLPGTGKSTILSASSALVATTLRCPVSFFQVSAATLMSKWVGESENSIKCLYELAEEHGPSLISIDEVDGIMRARRDGEDEYVRRFKTTFLETLQGVRHYKNVVTVAGTNKGWDIDGAFLRRFQRVFYLPLPNQEQRIQILGKAFEQEIGVKYQDLSFNDEHVLQETEGFTGDDLFRAVKNAVQKTQMFMVNGVVLSDREMFTCQQEFASVTSSVEMVEEAMTWVNFLNHGIKSVVPASASNDARKMVRWTRQFNIESSEFEDEIEQVNQARDCTCLDTGTIKCRCCCVSWCHLL